MPVPALIHRQIAGVVQRSRKRPDPLFHLLLVDVSHVQPFGAAHNSRVFWAVITMQSGITRILIGIPLINPACAIHSPRKKIALRSHQVIAHITSHPE